MIAKYIGENQEKMDILLKYKKSNEISEELVKCSQQNIPCHFGFLKLRREVFKERPVIDSIILLHRAFTATKWSEVEDSLSSFLITKVSTEQMCNFMIKRNTIPELEIGIIFGITHNRCHGYTDTLTSDKLYDKIA